jgi:ABC-type transporter Mla subunit MlaD
MDGRGVYLRVGLLVVGGIALMAGLIWFLAGAKIMHGELFESYFSESVQGLEVGAAVRYRGVTIGRVTALGLVNAEYGGSGRSIEIARQTYRLVFVRFELDTTRIGRVRDTQASVALGLRVRLASQGITGISYLELDFVDPAHYPPQAVPWQPIAQYIPSMPSTFTQVQDAAQHVLAKLNSVDFDGLATQLNALLAELRDSFGHGDVHTTLVEAVELFRAINSSLRAADLPGLTAEIRESSVALRNTLQGAQMEKLLSNAGLAADRLASATTRLPALIESVQATAQRAGSGTADVERGLIPLLRDMQITAQNLREISESLRSYPGQVFSQPPPRNPERAR